MAHKSTKLPSSTKKGSTKVSDKTYVSGKPATESGGSGKYKEMPLTPKKVSK